MHDPAPTDYNYTPAPVHRHLAPLDHSPEHAPRPPPSCPPPALLPSRAVCGGRTSECWALGAADPECPGAALCCHDGCANVCVSGARHSTRRRDPGPAPPSPRPRHTPAPAPSLLRRTTPSPPRVRRPLPTAYHDMPAGHTYVSPAPRLVHRADPSPHPRQATSQPAEEPSLYPYLYVLSSYVPQDSKGSSLVVAKRL